MRGVVSLAAALALPLTLSDGTDFPFRNLILFITFCVILMTLVIQGLTLPILIRLFRVEDPDKSEEAEKNLRTHLSYTAIEYIESNYTQEDATRDALHHLKTKYEKRVDAVFRRMLTIDLSHHSEDVFREFSRLQIQLINFERKEIKKLRHKHVYDDDILRKVEYELDLEEAALQG